MAPVPVAGSQLTHLPVAIFPHPSYLPSCNCQYEGFGRQEFYFSLPLLFYPFDLFLSCLASLTAPTYFSSLIIPSCVKLAVSCSQRNRLTFALGYCSHLVALKCLNIQNPTLHLRHRQISAATISHLNHKYTVWPYGTHSWMFSTFSHTPVSGHTWYWANIW